MSRRGATTMRILKARRRIQAVAAPIALGIGIGTGGLRGSLIVVENEPNRDGGSRRSPGCAAGTGTRSGNARPEAPAEPLAVNVRFLPHQRAFDNVIAQIKSAPVAYSVFALARLFLEKPERYDVRLTMPEGVQLFRLGEEGPVASDRRILESSAFASARDDFYTVEVVQSEPLKGNFSNVARCRLSGTLLGPTNHHAYQPQLRNLYEARFSRRMSFADYQRQIDIVSDPAVVEQWKEQARSVTTYHAKNAEPPISFSNVADAERHFRQTHLPALLREANEVTISGVLSRQLPDRRLGREIENAWAQETRSPSKMMQELAGGLRQAGPEYFPAPTRDAFCFARSGARFWPRARRRFLLDQRAFWRKFRQLLGSIGSNWRNNSPSATRIQPSPSARR